MHVRSTPSRAEIGEYIELRQHMIVRASRVGEVGVAGQVAIILPIDIFAACINGLVIGPCSKFCAPIVARVFLNAVDPEVLLSVVGDDGHYSGAWFVVIVDCAVESPDFARPVVSVSVFPLSVCLKVVEAQIQGGHHGTIVSALIVFAAVVVLPGGFYGQSAFVGEGVAPFQLSHVVHDLLVRIVDAARPGVEIDRLSYFDTLAQEFFISHLCTEEHAHLGGVKTVEALQF